MPVIRNPRVGETFESPDLKCSICDQLSTHYILIQQYRICKSCLTDFIEEIDFEMIKDIKNVKLEKRQF